MSWISFALIASLLKSISNISEKHVLFKEDALSYTTAFSLAIAILSLPFLFFIKDTSLSSTDLLIIYISSLTSVASSLTAANCIKKLDISESAPLYALSPLIVTFLSIIILKEHVFPLQLVGILITVFGVFVLEYHTHTRDLNEDKKIRIGAYGVLAVSLIFFSLSAVLDRFVIHNRSIAPLTYLLIIQFFVFLNIVIYDTLFFKKSKTASFDIKVFFRISFWINIVCIIAHRVVHTFTVQMIGASLLNSVKQVNVFFTTLIGGKLFEEKHILQRLVGCVCIIAGITLIVIFSI